MMEHQRGDCEGGWCVDDMGLGKVYILSRRWAFAEINFGLVTQALSLKLPKSSSKELYRVLDLTIDSRISYLHTTTTPLC